MKMARRSAVAAALTSLAFALVGQGSGGYALAAAGTITEYPLPPTGIGPGAITAGPDGNLWVTEAGDPKGEHKIAKMTTKGDVTEYTIPPVWSYPAGIAAGSDGNLWFTERSLGKIGRITTSGAITEYDSPT